MYIHVKKQDRPCIDANYSCAVFWLDLACEALFTLFCGIYFFILLSLHLKPCCCLTGRKSLLFFFIFKSVAWCMWFVFFSVFLLQTSFQTIKTLKDEPQKRKIGSANDSNLLDRESNCCVRVLLVRLHVLAIQTFFWRSVSKHVSVSSLL